MQLGGLVHHVHRRGDLAAVVHEGGDAQLATVAVVHAEVRERTVCRAVGGLGDHHGEHRHAFTVLAGVGGFLVDCGVDQVDQGFEQLLQLVDEPPLGIGDGGLRGERLGQPPFLLGKAADGAAVRVEGVDELQYADGFAVVVDEGDGKKGAGDIAGAPVEFARAGEIETLGAVDIVDVHGLLPGGGVRRHHAVVGPPVGVEQGNVRQVDLAALAAAQAQAEAAVDEDGEFQGALRVDAVDGAGVGMRELHGGEQDLLEQMVDVLLARQGHADGVQAFQLIERGIGIHGMPHGRKGTHDSQPCAPTGAQDNALDCCRPRAPVILPEPLFVTPQRSPHRPGFPVLLACLAFSLVLSHAWAQGVAHAQLVPDVGVVDAEVHHHQVGEQQFLEHVGADIARASMRPQ